MFGFVFPPWFQRSYPDAMINIRRNSQRLTTPFDINPTLKNVLHYQGSGKGNVRDRGISLFKQVLGTYLYNLHFYIILHKKLHKKLRSMLLYSVFKYIFFC
jgi:hypothetical protein